MSNALKNIAFSAILGLVGTFAAAEPSHALDKVTYGTNWLAQAEHGGFYQAVADGTYAKHGLDVTIVQGGPNAANSALLISGKIDFYMGGPQGEISAVEQGIPIVDVAAIFQKDPQVLLAHPDAGVEKFEDLAKLSTIFMDEGELQGFQGRAVQALYLQPGAFPCRQTIGPAGLSHLRALRNPEADRLGAESLPSRR
jgi:NitT/TauT family transport system substrate-binding protein